MFYFGGGYPGLYFPAWWTKAPPADVAIFSVDVPMAIVTGGLTRVIPVTRALEQALSMTLRATVPMALDRTTVDMPMYVPRSATVEATPVDIEVPMHVVTGGTTRVVEVTTAYTQTIPLPLTTTLGIVIGPTATRRMQVPTVITLEGE